MFKIKATLIALALSGQLSIASTHGDWTTYQSSETGELLCLAETTRQLDNIKLTFSLQFPKDGRSLPKISIYSTSTQLEGLDLKSLNVRTNNSDNADISLFATRPYLANSNEESDYQEFTAPLWKTMRLLEDIIRDNTLEVVARQNDNSSPLQNFNFSLSGSSKVIQSMVKNCLGVDTFKTPFNIERIIDHTTIVFLNRFTADTVNSDTKLSVSELWQQNEKLNDEVNDAFKASLDILDAFDDEQIHNETLVQFEEKLNKAQTRLTDLLTEKELIIENNKKMPTELSELEDKIANDEGQRPALNESHRHKRHVFLAIEENSHELQLSMDDYETDVFFHQNNLEKIETKIKTTQDRLAEALSSFDSIVNSIEDLENRINISDLESDLADEETILVDAIYDFKNFYPDQYISQQLLDDFNYTSKVTQIKSLNNELNDFQNTLKIKRKERRISRDQLKIEQASLASAQSQLKTLDQTIAQLENEKASSHQESESINAQRSTIDTEKQKQAKEYNTNCGNGYQDNQKDYCEGLINNQKKMAKQIADINNTDKTNISRRANIERNIESSLELKKSLPTTVENIKNEVSTLEADVAKLKTSIDDLESDINMSTSKKERLTVQTKRKRKKIAESAQYHYQGLERIVENQNSVVVEIVRKINDYDNKMSSLNRNYSEVNDQIKQLESDIGHFLADALNTRSDLKTATERKNEFAVSPVYIESTKKVDNARLESEQATLAYEELSQRLNTNISRVRVIHETLDKNRVRLPELPFDLRIERENIAMTSNRVDELVAVQEQMNEKSIDLKILIEELTSSVLDRLYDLETSN